MIRKRVDRKRVEVQVPLVKGFISIYGVYKIDVSADGYLNVWSVTSPATAQEPVGGVSRQYNFAPGAWSYYIVTELE